MAKPEPQPAAAAPRVIKARDPHPAVAGQTAALSPEPLVPFATRVPAELRQRYQYLRYATGRSVQDLATEALQEYADRHSAKE